MSDLNKNEHYFENRDGLKDWEQTWRLSLRNPQKGKEKQKETIDSARETTTNLVKISNISEGYRSRSQSLKNRIEQKLSQNTNKISKKVTIDNSGSSAVGTANPNSSKKKQEKSDPLVKNELDIHNLIDKVVLGSKVGQTDIDDDTGSEKSENLSQTRQRLEKEIVYCEQKKSQKSINQNENSANTKMYPEGNVNQETGVFTEISEFTQEDVNVPAKSQAKSNDDTEPVNLHKVVNASASSKAINTNNSDSSKKNGDENEHVKEVNKSVGKNEKKTDAKTNIRISSPERSGSQRTARDSSVLESKPLSQHVTYITNFFKTHISNPYNPTKDSTTLKIMNLTKTPETKPYMFSKTDLMKFEQIQGIPHIEVADTNNPQNKSDKFHKKNLTKYIDQNIINPVTYKLNKSILSTLNKEGITIHFHDPSEFSIEYLDQTIRSTIIEIDVKTSDRLFVITKLPNGDTEQFLHDNEGKLARVYYYSKFDVSEISFFEEEKTQYVFEADGQIETVYSSGLIEIRTEDRVTEYRSDNTSFTVYASGVQETVYADGSRCVILQNGKEILVDEYGKLKQDEDVKGVGDGEEVGVTEDDTDFDPNASDMDGQEDEFDPNNDEEDGDLEIVDEESENKSINSELKVGEVKSVQEDEEGEEEVEYVEEEEEDEEEEENGTKTAEEQKEIVGLNNEETKLKIKESSQEENADGDEEEYEEVEVTDPENGEGEEEVEYEEVEVTDDDN